MQSPASKFIFTVLAAAVAALLQHFVPEPYTMPVLGAYTSVCLHYGISFGPTGAKKAPRAPALPLLALCCVLALPLVGCGASLGPVLAQVASYLADGGNGLDAVAAAVDTWFALHPDPAKQAAIAQKLDECRLGLSAAAHATSGGQDLDARKADAAFDQFRASYLELEQLLRDAGVGSAGPGARARPLPEPICMRPLRVSS